jgi:hypothetical protein
MTKKINATSARLPGQEQQDREERYLDLAGQALLAGITREPVIAQVVARVRRPEGYLAYRPRAGGARATTTR